VGLVQKAIKIDYDIQSEIFMVESPAYHLNTKNFDIQYHFCVIYDQTLNVVAIKGG